jgi:hypothetical protein
VPLYFLTYPPRKLARKAAEKAKKHHKKLGDPTSDSQQDDRRELAERDWKESVPILPLVSLYHLTYPSRKLARKAAEKAKKHHKKLGDPTSDSQQDDRRELAGSLYGRDFADFIQCVYFASISLAHTNPQTVNSSTLMVILRPRKPRRRRNVRRGLKLKMPPRRTRQPNVPCMPTAWML